VLLGGGGGRKKKEERKKRKGYEFNTKFRHKVLNKKYLKQF